MRRRAGVGAVHKKTLEQERYKDKGTEIQDIQLEQMTKQVEVFRKHLEDFALRHNKDIKLDPQFRRQFQIMCAATGVDPLTSAKGFWSVLGIGDFYYELAVQIIEVCLATSHKNGGLIGLDELRTRLIKARGQRKEHQEITSDDLLRSAKKLKTLDGGFKVLEVVKGNFLVQSVPIELSMDQTAVLQLIANRHEPFIVLTNLCKSLGWQQPRGLKALEGLVTDGLAWLDSQSPGEYQYWFPSMFEDCIKA